MQTAGVQEKTFSVYKIQALSQSGDPMSVPGCVVIGESWCWHGVFCYYLLLQSQFALFAVGRHPELCFQLEPSWIWKYFSSAPADIDMEPTSYPNNPINEPSHRIWFRFKFINSDWNGSWIGCLCFDYNRSLTKSITIDCNGVRSSIMIIYERAQSESRAANNPSVFTITEKAPSPGWKCLLALI